MRFPVAILLAAIVSAMGVEASSQVRVGFLSLETEGEVAGIPQEELEETIISGLTGVEVIPMATLARGSGLSQDGLASCADESCRAQILEGSGSHCLLTVSVGGELNFYSFSGRVISRGGRTISETQGDCELCTLAELRERLATALGSLREEIPESVDLSFNIAPEGAVVRVDGQAADGGTARLEPGTHHILVEAEGYQSHEEEIVLWLGDDETVDVELEPSDGTARPPPGGRDEENDELGALGISGIVLAASGSALAIGGVAALALNGRCAGGRTDASGECEFIYSSVGIGAALLSVGVAAVIAGVVLIILEKRRARRQTETSLRPLRLSFESLIPRF